MIILSQQAIRNAFDKYIRLYSSDSPNSRGWPISHHLELYKLSNDSFQGEGDPISFDTLYVNLKNKWKAFRNAQSCWSSDVAFRILKGLNPPMRNLRLSQVTPAHWETIWETICAVRDIKINRSGDPSLVAISKFLHFWNPRLFIIFDYEVVENIVFGTSWLKVKIPSIDEVQALCESNLKNEPRLAEYLRILVFASKFIRENNQVKGQFAQTVRANAGGVTIPADIETYEATAVEWCLLGLVEIPPQGVTFEA